MQALKQTLFVDKDQSLRIPDVPFPAGSMVEVIVLSGEPNSTIAFPDSNSEEAREKALRLLLENPVPLGGVCPKRDELYSY